MTIQTGAAFTLYDDDDFNENDGTNLHGDNGEDVAERASTFSLMEDSDDPAQNVFAAAYIRPVRDGGGNMANNTSNIPLNLNVSSTIPDISNQLALGRNSGAYESNDFWVVYVQVGYQPGPPDDNDPYNENELTGVTIRLGGVSVDTVVDSSGVPRGGEGALVFIETMRDADRQEGLGSVRNRVGTAPHEIGHQFGLQGDARNFGIMSSGGGIEPLVFIPEHLNVLRWRIKSPGQP